MFKIKFLNSRYAISYSFILIYLLVSFLLRSVFYALSFGDIEFSFFSVIKTFGLGFVYDLGTAVFFIFIYAFYLLIVSGKIAGSLFDKIISYIILFLILFITFFSFLGEIPFWDEFHTRYNFISVDYLIYTYEVIENINQSYPIPLLVLVILLLCTSVFFTLLKFKKIEYAFKSKPSFKHRLVHFLPLLGVSLLYIYFIENKQAEFSNNTYTNELSKNGVYSFFAAYRSNELDFKTFYNTLDEKKAFGIIKKELKQRNQDYVSQEYSNIIRKIKSDSTETKPNIILICIESFNADFMETFGNNQTLTPNIDQLSSESVLFTDMYATGTRTVRGMEAITLSVPPTPGHSIVRRPNNSNLYSIASVLKQKDYALNFFYGGDGYFDNMNNFFGGQGFNIIDRNRGNPLSDNIKTTRTNITDSEITFENAWGICDADIYSKVLKEYDENYTNKNPLFSFVMTTSNHRPYTFPDNKIDLPQGSRESAVKYTDYALGEFIKKAKTKPWFKNTVFVIVSDHCASSAGRWEITINKHHIPAFIYNLPEIEPKRINKLVSQIDIMPTTFGYLNWNYHSALYGKDINKMTKEEERALIGNYRTVGLLKDSIFTEINDRKKVNQYIWDNNSKQMSEMQMQNKVFKKLTTSYYQTASERFKNGLMKEKTN